MRRLIVTKIFPDRVTAQGGVTREAARR